MAKVEPTEKFNELGIENNYQGLHTEDYTRLFLGFDVDIDYEIPEHLVKGGYVKVIKDKKKGGEE